MKKNPVILLLLILIIINSCVDNNPVRNSGFNYLTSILSIPDSLELKALVMIKGSINYETIDSSRLSASAEVYLTDLNGNFINADSVVIQGVKLNNYDNYVGQYTARITYPEVTPFLTYIKIKNYLGDNFQDTIEALPIMNILNFKCADTISKTNGTTIYYSGYSNEALNIQIIYDEALTGLLINADSANITVPTVDFVANNNGSLFIPSNIINDLPSNKYYCLLLYHRKFMVLDYNNYNIGAYIEYSIQIPFYLND